MNNETNTPVAESGRPKDVTGRIETEIRTYDLLDSLNIPYMRFDHEAAVAFRTKCKIFSRHLQNSVSKAEKGRFKGL